MLSIHWVINFVFTSPSKLFYTGTLPTYEKKKRSDHVVVSQTYETQLHTHPQTSRWGFTYLVFP